MYWDHIADSGFRMEYVEFADGTQQIRIDHREDGDPTGDFEVYTLTSGGWVEAYRECHYKDPFVEDIEYNYENDPWKWTFEDLVSMIFFHSDDFWEWSDWSDRVRTFMFEVEG